MTAVNSKSFLKLLASAFLITGCGTEKQEAPSHKCQAIVILDKTASVIYANKLSSLQQKLSSNFDATYASATQNIQCSRIVITDQTNVFPQPDQFTIAYPNVEDANRTTEQAVQRWKSEKRKWITDEVKQIVAQIESTCTSNTTDIFSIFTGIQSAQKSNAPWDSINVYIFSDMINTTSTINMMKLSIENAQEKGKSICQKLIADGRISAGNTESLNLTIYTPDGMNKTAMLGQFWKGFFGSWGLRETQYHFE